MQFITTKYLPATNHKGSRIKATCERGSITISFSDEADNDGEKFAGYGSTKAPHMLAVDKLIQKFNEEDFKRYGSQKSSFVGDYVIGSNNTGYVFVRNIEPVTFGE